MKDVADRAGEVWITAETKLAEELDRLPKAKGDQGNPGGRGAKNVRSQDGSAHPPTLQDLGIDKKRAARARKIGGPDPSHWPLSRL